MTAEQMRETYRALREGAEDEALAHVQANRDANRRARHEKALERAAIPPKYRGLGFDDYIAELPGERFAREIARDYAERFASGPATRGAHSPNLMFLGGSRCGKTQLACAIVEAILARLYTGVVVKASTIIMECRGVYDREDIDEATVLDRYITPDLLVIDEIGDEGTGREEFRRQKIGYIIDERTENLRPTILIGNITEAALHDHIGERAYNRIREHSLDPVAFEWTPYLRRQGKLSTPDTAKRDSVVMQGVFRG